MRLCSSQLRRSVACGVCVALVLCIRPLVHLLTAAPGERVGVHAPFVIALLLAPGQAAIRSMEELPNAIPAAPPARDTEWLSRDWRSASDARALSALLFEVERTVAHSVIPPKMRKKLRENGRDEAKFERQECITIANRFLPHEALSFNRVRSQRFTGQGSAGGGALSPASQPGSRTELSADAEVGGPQLNDLAAALDRQRCQVRRPPTLGVGVSGERHTAAVAADPTFAYMHDSPTTCATRSTRRWRTRPSATCRAMPLLRLQTWGALRRSMAWSLHGGLQGA